MASWLTRGESAANFVGGLWRGAAAAVRLGQMSAKSTVESVVNWLRAGYPDGVPGPDRIPLLSLLRSSPLTEEEIREIVGEIAAEEAQAPVGHQIDHDEIERFISGHVHHDAGETNIRRVAAKLAAAGWPLAGIDGIEAGDDSANKDPSA